LVRRRSSLWARVEWDGVYLVTHAPTLKARGATLERLARLLDVSVAVLDSKVSEQVDTIHAVDERDDRIHMWRNALPVVEAASVELVLNVTERSFELRGVKVERRYVRRYPRGDLAAHAVGYLGMPSAREASRDREAGVLLDGDRGLLGVLHGGREELDGNVRLRDEQYGRRGAERTFDPELRGVPGVDVGVRDVKNRLREQVTSIAPREGRAVSLSLDTALQSAAEGALDRAVTLHGDEHAGGAVVVLDLRDGGLLSLATSPRFDSNRLRERGYYRSLLDDPRRPLRNRAIEPYAPGSTLKILSAFAMFDPKGEHSLSQGWTTNCQKFFSAKEKRFKCDGLHNVTGLTKSVSKSCNLFYFRAADRIGLNPITAWCRKLGLGQRVAKDVFGERKGVVPYVGLKKDRADEMKQSLAAWSVRLSQAMQNPDDVEAIRRARGKALRAAWYCERYMADQILWPGDVRNAIIGQGAMSLTPLQVTLIAAMIASDGEVPMPKLDLGAATRIQSMGLDPRTLAKVKRGMKLCVKEGTASSPKIGLRRFDVAGKTGTAQRYSDQPYIAWFTGFYPASNPEIAFPVLVDRTRGHGGGVCGPVAKSVLEAYEKSRGGTLR
jgi:penicillin-binding protein 2